MKKISHVTKRVIDGLHAIATANGAPIDGRSVQRVGQRLVLQHAERK